MYYILDTSLTLIKRLLQRKKIWLAHKEHFYQKVVQSGMGHGKVVKLIIALQISIILTCYILENPYLIVFLSFLESLGLIIYFSSKYKKST
jgi:UDP-N-acetylmuramyl pentapeptide phosphotransferase/UDP-N-acetylglucosamine-1-phosphate transferase